MWDIETRLIDAWLKELDNATLAHIRAALELLEEHGPRLGRPLVDSVIGSRHHNMKELRPGSVGRSEIRILFVFDPNREAIFLVGGDKSSLWSRWYRRSILKADRLYDIHLTKLKGK